MRNLKSRAIGAMALACIAVASGSAQAQSYAFGAGTTIPSIAYRQLSDCWYAQAQGSSGKPGAYHKAVACPGFNSSGLSGGILYTPTTLGNGSTVLRTNSLGQVGAPSAANAVPWTDATIGVANTADYDGIQFTGIDDVVTAADVTAWSAAGNPANFGNIIQIPALVVPVAIGFNGTD